MNDNLPAVAQTVASLPALVQRASQALANATTAAEVLDAKAAAGFAYDAAKAAARFAKSKGAYDEVITAVYRAQADALEIEAMAKRRFADEYDAAQERGEMMPPSGGQGGATGVPTRSLTEIGKLADIGVSANDVLLARKTRDAEAASPGITRAALDDIVARGDEPTKAALGREINTRLNSFSGDNEWYTPARYIEMAREVMGTIDVDPASNNHAQATVRATTFYTEANSGLDKPWGGKVWMNPPYSNPEVQQFSEKVINEYLSGRVTEAVVLTNNSGDTAWHHSMADVATAMCITRGRIKFESPTRASNSPAMGQSFFYFGPHIDRFAEVFSEIGRITVNYDYQAKEARLAA